MKKNTNIISIVAAVLLSVVAQAQTIIPNGATAPQLPLPGVQAAYDANRKVNFVRTWEARKAVTDASQQSLDHNVNFKTASVYFDGLGRPLQTVVKGNNYDGTKDIVSMNQYDEFGRVIKQYLPYAPASGSNGKFRLNPFAEQQAYYNTSYQDQTPFSKTDIEASPLNRPLKSFAPGNSWAGDNKGIEQQFTVNTPDEEVRVATIGYTPGAVPGFGNIYPAGDLIKSVAIDEHGKKVVEYKTKNGLVILKKVQLSNTPGVSYTGWLSTVYIYDDFSRLRYVVQPKGVEWLVQNGWNFSMPGGTEVVNELCFIYEYDAEGHIVYKKVPGASHTYMCYDKWDRLVFVQDAKLRSQGQWMVTWYDDLNRPTNTALYNVAQTPAQVQLYLDPLTPVNPVPVFDEYYLTRLSNTYYDEYSISGAAAFNQAMVNTAQANIITGDETPDVLNKTDLTRGMLTSAETKVLGTTTFLKTTIYYDTKARAIQTYSTNYRGGTDVTTSVYSYTGKPLSNYLAHNNPSVTLYGTQNITVFTRNVYNNDYITCPTCRKTCRVGNEIWRGT